MNKILSKILVLSLIAAMGFSSCDDETTKGFTDITYYPSLDVLGDPVVIVDKGAAYDDAGCYAELNGEDVTDQVEIISDVDTDEPGVYSINYSITNSDGFSVTGSRTVYVADPTPSIISNGIHTVADGTYRFWYSSSATVAFSGYEIIILQIEPGVFYISDFMGGYYDQRAGYGSNYAMTGTFQLNADNTITPLSSYVAGWGDSMDAMSETSVDATTGQIKYKMGYAALMDFYMIID